MQKLLFNDVKVDQFEREREAFANKKEFIKLEAEALEKKRGLMLMHWKIILDYNDLRLNPQKLIIVES